jgi:hypothetical protein
MVILEADMNLQDTGKGQLYVYFPDLFKKAGVKDWPIGKPLHLKYDTDKPNEIIVQLPIPTNEPAKEAALV